MKRTPVKSSAMKSVGYDATTKTLEIEFTGRNTMQYLDVPPSTHAALMAAKSHGEYFNASIKGKYRERG